jgi:hypothetical protein
MPPHATRATIRSAASVATLTGKAKASAKKAVDDEDNEFLSDEYKSSGEDSAKDEAEELDDDSEFASEQVKGKGKAKKKPGTKRRFALGESKAPKKRRVATAATLIREEASAELSQPADIDGLAGLGLEDVAVEIDEASTPILNRFIQFVRDNDTKSNTAPECSLEEYFDIPLPKFYKQRWLWNASIRGSNARKTEEIEGDVSANGDAEVDANDDPEIDAYISLEKELIALQEDSNLQGDDQQGVLDTEEKIAAWEARGAIYLKAAEDQSGCSRWLNEATISLRQMVSAAAQPTIVQAKSPDAQPEPLNIPSSLHEQEETSGYDLTKEFGKVEADLFGGKWVLARGRVDVVRAYGELCVAKVKNDTVAFVTALSAIEAAAENLVHDAQPSGSGMAGVEMPQDDLDVETKDADFGPTADSPDYRRQAD